MKKYFDVLRRCPLFSEIAEPDLTEMLNCLEAKTAYYRKGETILAEGEPVPCVGIVLSGAVQIIQNDYFGNRSIVANIEAPGLFGESFACAGVTAIPVSVVTSQHTEVMQIDCSKITRTCRNTCPFHQQMMYNLLRIVAEKNLVFYQKIEVTSKRTTKEKLLTYLSLQAKKNQSMCFDIPYSRQELADYLEVERSGLSVEISKLCKQGVIAADQRRIQIMKAIHS